MGCGSSIPSPVLATATPDPVAAKATPVGAAAGAVALNGAAVANGALNGTAQAKQQALSKQAQPSGKLAFDTPPTAAAGADRPGPPLERTSMPRPKTSIVNRLLPDEEAMARLQGLKTSHPQNLGAKHFSREYYNSLEKRDQTALLRCLRVGTYHPTAAGAGCFAIRSDDYDKLRKFFAPLVADYHGVPEKCGQPANWALPSPLDFSEIGLGPSLARIGVGRNFAAFPLPGAMNRKQRLELEDLMAEATAQLAQQDMPNGMPFGGRYFSLSPGRHDVMREQDYLGLVKQGVMFKDMNNDPLLMTAGIASEWPYGRGAYISKCRRIFIWINEQDHLRVSVFCPAATSLFEPMELLQATLTILESILGADAFKKSEEFGFVTSCPTLVGSGMKASLTLKVPQLVTTGGGDIEKILELAKGHPVSIRPAQPGSSLFERTPIPGATSAGGVSSTATGASSGPWEGARLSPQSGLPTPAGNAANRLSPLPPVKGGKDKGAAKKITKNTGILPQLSLSKTSRVAPEPVNHFVEITSTSTFGISEAELVQRIYDAAKAIMVEENKLQAVIDAVVNEKRETEAAARVAVEAERKRLAAERKKAMGLAGEEEAEALVQESSETKVTQQEDTTQGATRGALEEEEEEEQEQEEEQEAAAAAAEQGQLEQLEAEHQVQAEQNKEQQVELAAGGGQTESAAAEAHAGAEETGASADAAHATATEGAGAGAPSAGGEAGH